MTQRRKSDLLAEVLGVGAGQVPESAMSSRQGQASSQTPPARPVGRPPKEATIPFTLRLRKETAQLLQALVADLQARALEGEIARGDATIGTVVEEGLRLYAAKHGIVKANT
jgi:hypothetical protein